MDVGRALPGHDRRGHAHCLPTDTDFRSQPHLPSHPHRGHSQRPRLEERGLHDTAPALGFAAPLWPVILDSAVRLQAQGPTRQAAIDTYDRMVEAARKYDANDFLYWLDSSWDYDPQPALNRIKAHVVAVNFADDVINAADLGMVKTLVESVPTARFVLIPEDDRTVGHLTLALAGVWKSYLERLLRESSSEAARRE